MLVSLDESVLHDIERVILMAQHAERERVGPTVIALEQRLERVAIAALGPLDQVGIIDWLTSYRRALALLIHAADGYITPGQPRLREL